MIPAILATAYGSLDGLQVAAQQIFLAHRLRAAARVDAGASQEKKPLDPGFERRLDDVAFNHQVLINEIGPVGVVGVDAAHPGRRHEHRIDLLPPEEFRHRPLVDQVQLRMRASDDAAVAIRLEPAHDGRTDHAAVAGDIDGGAFGKHWGIGLRHDR